MTDVVETARRSRHCPRMADARLLEQKLMGMAEERASLQCFWTWIQLLVARLFWPALPSTRMVAPAALQ